MAKYRKKPIVVEARQYTAESCLDIQERNDRQAQFLRMLEGEALLRRGGVMPKPQYPTCRCWQDVHRDLCVGCEGHYSKGHPCRTG